MPEKFEKKKFVFNFWSLRTSKYEYFPEMNFEAAPRTSKRAQEVYGPLSGLGHSKAVGGLRLERVSINRFTYDGLNCSWCSLCCGCRIAGLS